MRDPSRMYAARVIPHDVYAERSFSLLEITSLDANGDLSEGVRLAYCLKLLIGLRTDAAFPRYAVFRLATSLCFSLLFPFASRSLYRIRRIYFLDYRIRATPPPSPALLSIHPRRQLPRCQPIVGNADSPPNRRRRGCTGCCVRF